MATFRSLRFSAAAILSAFVLASYTPIVENARAGGTVSPRVEEDTGRAAKEIESKRHRDPLIPKGRTGPTLGPALDHDVTHGSHWRGLHDALGR
jgi:hypothetical protein